MRMRFFTVPVHGSSAAEEELNRFLGSVRVIDLDRQFVAESGASFWAVAVTFVEAQREEPKSRLGLRVARARGRVGAPAPDPSALPSACVRAANSKEVGVPVGRTERPARRLTGSPPSLCLVPS